MSGGEYRGKIIIEADTSGAKEATKQVNNMAAAFTGANALMRGTAAVLRGNATGFMDMAVGARVLWTALGAVNIYLKVATLALTMLGPIVSNVTSVFRNSRPIEDYTDRLKKLGLALSDLDRHKEAGKNVAANLNRIKEAADAARAAILKVADAQLALNQAQGEAKLASVDLEEANKLAGAGSDEERRDIQREYSNKRADVQKTNIESEFELKKKRNIEAREALREDAASDVRQRGALAEGVETSKKLIADQVAAIAKQITDAELPAIELTTGQQHSRQLQASREQREQDRKAREKEIIESFANDPTKGIEKLRGAMGADKEEELVGAIDYLATQKKALSDFDASADSRAVERSGKFVENDLARQALDQQKATALNRVETTRINTISGIDQQAKAAQEAVMALAKLEAQRDAEAKQNASDAEGRYRFDKADPAQQMDYLNRVLKNMSGKELSPEQRLDRVDLLKMRDRVQAGMDRDAKATEKKQADRDAQIADAREGLRESGRGVAQTIDTSAIFEAYHAGGVNKTQDAQQLIADRAKEQIAYLKIIANSMKGESV